MIEPGQKYIKMIKVRPIFLKQDFGQIFFNFWFCVFTDATQNSHMPRTIIWTASAILGYFKWKKPQVLGRKIGYMVTLAVNPLIGPLLLQL